MNRILAAGAMRLTGAWCILSEAQVGVQLWLHFADDSAQEVFDDNVFRRDNRFVHQL